MRSILAIFFRFLFKISFFKPHFFGIHKRIFLPLNLFKGVIRKVKFKSDILLKLDISDWVQENLYFLDAYEDSELLFMKNTNQDKIVSLLTKFGCQKWFINEDGTLSKTQKNTSRMNFIFAKKDS